MINAMDTATSHLNDLVGIPLTRTARIAQHPKVSERPVGMSQPRPQKSSDSRWLERSLRELYPFCHSWAAFCQGIPMLLACQLLE